MRLVVTAKELRYAGRQMVAGDEFEASDKDAKILKGAKKAADPNAAAMIPAIAPMTAVNVPVPPASHRHAQQDEVGSMFNKQPESGASDADQSPPKRRYRRRDLTAEQ